MGRAERGGGGGAGRDPERLPSAQREANILKLNKPHVVLSFVAWSARAHAIRFFRTCYSWLCPSSQPLHILQGLFPLRPFSHSSIFLQSLMHGSPPMAAYYLRSVSSLWFIFQLPSGRGCGPAAHLYIHWAILPTPQPPDSCRWRNHFSYGMGEEGRDRLKHHLEETAALEQPREQDW